MTTTAIRERLITYIADADDKKLKALYTLLEQEIEQSSSYKLTEDHLSIVDERRVAYETGKSRGQGWKEAHDDIRKGRKKA